MREGGVTKPAYMGTRDILGKVWGDFVGLGKVCGWPVAFQWLCQLVLRAREIFLERNLQPADRALGPGPWKVRLPRYGCTFMVYGPQAISGIREMYVRDIYLRGGWLQVEPGDVVVDLGANMGNFTNLALASHPDVRVVAVEPSLSLNNVFRQSVGLNPGFLDRVLLVQAFVGSLGPKQIELMRDPDYNGAPVLSEEELIAHAKLDKIDFLKCDIEGSEFGLLRGPSRILEMTRKIACEVHAFAGDPEELLEHVRAAGFEIGPLQPAADGSVTFLARRR